MKIWLDTTPAGQSGDNQYRGGKECDNECDNECFRNSDHFQNIELPLSGDDFQCIHKSALKQAIPLHIQECVQDRWLVCNPTGLGYVTVLDAEAHILLEQFRTPRSLASVMPAMVGASPERIEGTVALLYKAGLLQHNGQTPVRHEEGKAQSLSAWLHVTNACNLRCHYCYLEKTTERMAEDTAHRSVDAIFRSAVKHHFKHIRLRYAGGEASLHMASVIALHDYAAQSAQQHAITLHASLLSNGVVLSQRAIEQLQARHIGVMISLDGIGRYHDSQRPFIHGQESFQYVDRTITRLLANELVPHISVTVSQRNLSGLKDLLAYILEHNMAFTLNYYRDNNCATDDDLQFGEQQMIDAMRSLFEWLEHKLPARRLLDSFIDKSNLSSPHQRTCGVGQNYLVIDQRGGIAKCHADIKRTVTTIEADDPLQLIRDDRSGVQGLAVEEKEGCRTCDWRYWCTGGCPLLTYRVTGRFDVKSPNCTIYTALFPEVLRLEALRLLKYANPIIL